MNRAWLTPLLALVCACSASQPAAEEGAAADEGALTLKGVTAAERSAYLARADVWLEASPPRRSPEELVKGPPAEGAFPFNAEIACTFVEPDAHDPLGGMTPKFSCKLPSGEVVKVKYSHDGSNHEVYSEIMASRIAWAIGLPADRMYPVRVTCTNCPEEPWAAYVQTYGTAMNKLRYREPGPRGTRRFDVAAIERKLDAAKIEKAPDDAGWGFDELPRRDDSYFKLGAAERAAYDQAHPEQTRFDALRLYAAWAKHADNKADNQRLVCPKDAVTADKKCTRPIVMIHDMGISYGGGTELGGLLYEKVAKASLPGWTNDEKSPTWKDFDSCTASLRGSAWSGTLDNPRVSDAGRAMLASRLRGVDDAQLAAIFRAARIDEKGETWTDPDSGETRKVTSADWVRMFKVMVARIDRPCPERP